MTVRSAIVLADGDPPLRADLDGTWPGWAAEVDLVVAADGGARLAAALGLRLDAWVGDGDSLGAAGVDELRRAGIRIELVPTAKSESDAELALLVAIRAGARDVTVLGALGGPRLDHAIANVALLGHPAATGTSVRLLDGRTRVRLLAGPTPGAGPGTLDLAGRVGDVVSLIAVDDCEGVTTVGLRYPLRDEPLPAGPARGISNVRDDAAAEVRIRSGRLLVVEGPATLRR